MKKTIILLILVSLVVISSCTVSRPSYQSTYQPSNEKSADSYTPQEKRDYLNTYGVIEFRKKFGR